MSDIGLKIISRDAVIDGQGKLTISMPTSTKAMLDNNELLNILNTLKRSRHLDPSAQVGFEYTFDFAFEGVGKFPYGFDFNFMA